MKRSVLVACVNVVPDSLIVSQFLESFVVGVDEIHDGFGFDISSGSTPVVVDNDGSVQGAEVEEEEGVGGSDDNVLVP